MISVILSIFADAGNLINLFVLTRRHMRSTMTTLLVTLAWADLVPPTVVSLNNVLFYYFLPRMSQSSTFLTTHMITRALFNALATVFTTFSNWLIVLITTFRLIVVKVRRLALLSISNSSSEHETDVGEEAVNQSPRAENNALQRLTAIGTFFLAVNRSVQNERCLQLRANENYSRPLSAYPRSDLHTNVTSHRYGDRFPMYLLR